VVKLKSEDGWILDETWDGEIHILHEHKKLIWTTETHNTDEDGKCRKCDEVAPGQFQTHQKLNKLRDKPTYQLLSPFYMTPTYAVS
jgi:hypothetical protein